MWISKPREERTTFFFLYEDGARSNSGSVFIWYRIIKNIKISLNEDAGYTRRMKKHVEVNLQSLTIYMCLYKMSIS